MKPKEMLLSLMILGFTMDMAACLANKKELASQLNEPGLQAKDLEDTAQDSGLLLDDREFAIGSSRRKRQRKSCISNQETEYGQCCVFPFTYKGKQYDHCLSNNGKTWCATTSNWDADRKWGTCKDSSCRSNRKTEDEQCCVFPFTYWGKQYNGCTPDKTTGKPFCATTSSWDTDRLWGFCKDCPKGAETEDGQCCVFPFTYQGNQYDYCLSDTKSEIKGKMWCGTTSSYDDADSKWGTCKDSSCRSKTKTEEGQCCVFPFTYKGNQYNECQPSVLKNGKLWCALKSTFVNTADQQSYWGYCKAPPTTTQHPTTTIETQTTTSSACPEGFETSPSVNVCYRYFNELATKTEAMDKCAEIDSVLAMPKSKEETDLFIHVRSKPGYRCWIGMDDTKTEGTFYWGDGSRVDDGWTNWNGAEPNDWGNGEDCVQATTNGKWNDIRCSKPLVYMCQVSKQK